MDGEGDVTEPYYYPQCCLLILSHNDSARLPFYYYYYYCMHRSHALPSRRAKGETKRKGEDPIAILRFVFVVAASVTFAIGA